MNEITAENLNRVVKDYVEDNISVGIWYIEFEKKDGSLREMWCTRDSVLLPPEPPTTKEESTDSETTASVPVVKKANPNVNVYDLEAEGWRSFRPQSLKKAVQVNLYQYTHKYLGEGKYDDNNNAG